MLKYIIQSQMVPNSHKVTQKMLSWHGFKANVLIYSLTFQSPQFVLNS